MLPVRGHMIKFILPIALTCAMHHASCFMHHVLKIITKAIGLASIHDHGSVVFKLLLN